MAVVVPKNSNPSFEKVISQVSVLPLKQRKLAFGLALVLEKLTLPSSVSSVSSVTLKVIDTAVLAGIVISLPLIQPSPARPKSDKVMVVS